MVSLFVCTFSPHTVFSVESGSVPVVCSVLLIYVVICSSAGTPLSVWRWSCLQAKVQKNKLVDIVFFFHSRLT